MPRHRRSTTAAARRPRGTVAAALLAAAVMCSCAAHAAEYRIGAGDVLDVSIAQIPELPHRFAVQLDGMISLPLAGPVRVAGLTRTEAEAKIRSALAAKIYQGRSQGGMPRNIPIEPDDVTANIAEYRPVYVDGDVSRPGEHPFRPLMIVRQAVALSGGYDTLRFRAANSVMEGADLKSAYESLWIEFAEQQARIWRIKAELAGADDAAKLTLSDVPLPASTLAEIVQIETDAFNIRQSDHRRQKEFLKRTLAKDAGEIAILTEQEKQEQAGAKSDAEELERSLDLYSSRTITSPRVTDARRAVLLSSTRALQTSATLMIIKRRQDDTTRQLERLDDERRIRLLDELQVATAKLGEVRAKLQGAGDKLRYAAMLRSGINGRPAIVVVRTTGAGRRRFEATEDSELEPGDVVEISLQGPTAADAPTR